MHYKKLEHNLTDAEILDLFLREMQIRGLCFEAKDLPLQLNGKTHYVKVEGRSKQNRNSRSGWYNGYLGDFPSAKFGWMHGDAPTFTWSLYHHLKSSNEKISYRKLTVDEIKESERKLKQQQKARELEEKKRLDFSHALTLIEYHRSKPLTKHPYNSKKGFELSDIQSDKVRIYNPKNFDYKEVKDILDIHFPSYSTRINIEYLLDYQRENILFRGFNIAIFGETLSQKLIMFQLIFPEKSKKTGKDKHFPLGLIKQNNFHLVCSSINATSVAVIICEGWATGVSISRFINYKIAVLVAWDAGNITNVAKLIRKAYPNIKIYIPSDNDHTKPDDKNTGILFGVAACQAINGYLIPPPFNPNIPNYLELSDWNDIDLNLAFSEAQALFLDVFKKAQPLDVVYTINTITDYTIKNIEFDIQENYLEFNANFFSFFKIIKNGLINCDLNHNETTVAIADEKNRLASSFRRMNCHGHGDQQLILIDKNISNIFMTITQQIITQQFNPILHSDELTKYIQQLESYQYLIDLNLIKILQSILYQWKDHDLVDAILLKSLKESECYDNTEQWSLSLIEKIDASNIEVGILIPLIMDQKEYLYWQHNTPEKRQIAAIEYVLSEYNALLPDFIAQKSACMDVHNNKLPYVYAALSKAVLTHSNTDIDYFKKLNRRLVEVANVQVDFDI